MSEIDVLLHDVVEALRRRSERTLLQRRTAHVLDQIEKLLANGWSMAELATHLAAAGITQRSGQPLTSGHFAVMITRARARARRSTHRPRLPAAQARSEPPSSGRQAASANSDMAENLASIAERSARRVAEQERAAAVDRDIGATLDLMFGRNQTEAPPSPSDAKASSSSTRKRPRSRQPR